MRANKTIVSVLVAAVLLSSCGTPAVPEAAVGKPVRTVAVQKAPFSDEVRVAGRVAAAKESAVASQVTGVIRQVLVDAGTKVKAGQAMAVLDLSNSAISASYNSASDAYSNALASYSATKEALASDLTSAKDARDNLYRSTQPTLDTYKAQLADLNGKIGGSVLDSSKTALETFQKNAKASMDTFNSRLKNTYVSLRSSLQSAKATFDKALNQADIILGVSDANRGANAAYENLLAAKDSSRVATAKDAYVAARSAFDSWSYDGSSDAASEASLDALIPVSDKMADLYAQLVSVMQSTVPGGSFSQTSLDALSATVTGLQGSAGQGASTVLGAQSALTSTRLSVDDLKNTIQQTEVSNQATVLTLSNNVGLTRNQVESSVAGIQSQRDAADNAVVSAQARYNSSLSSSKQALAGSKGQKDVAGVQLANARITAPFDGFVLSRAVEVGNLVNPGTQLFVVGDSTSFRVKADVTTETAASLTRGQAFSVAKGLDSSSAILDVVAPGADPVTRMVRVEFALAKPAAFLKWGDYVDLYGSSSKTRDLVFSVPFSALVAFGQGDFQVMVVGSGSVVRGAQVKLGQQNSSRVEIVSGLSSGDEVVVQGALSLRDGDLVARIVDAPVPAASSEASPADRPVAP